MMYYLIQSQSTTAEHLRTNTIYTTSFSCVKVRDEDEDKERIIKDEDETADSDPFDFNEVTSSMILSNFLVP